MSWNPLKKITRHGSRSHLMQGDESILEKHVLKMQQLENSTKKLCTDAKKYEELIIQASEFEKKMTTDLSNSLLSEEDQLRCLFEEWHSFVSEITLIDENLALVIRCAVIDPLKKFQGVFSEARTAIKKREQALQDCGKCDQKVKKLQDKEKTGQNVLNLELASYEGESTIEIDANIEGRATENGAHPTMMLRYMTGENSVWCARQALSAKLYRRKNNTYEQNAKQTLAVLEDKFKGQDSVLCTELPQLYEGRIEYFQPCLEALIKSQVESSSETDKIFNQTIVSLNSALLSETDFRSLQNQRLSNIQALSIVADK